MGKSTRKALCSSVLASLAPITAMLFAVLGGSYASAQMAARAHRDEDSREAEMVIMLKRLGAGISPFDGSPELLSVVIVEGAAKSYPSFTCPWTGTDADLAKIGRLRNVAAVSLSCKVKDQGILKFLTELPRLRVISSTRASINDEGMSFVAKCSALEEFTAISKVTDVGLERLTGASNLRRLTIVYCTEITDKGLEGIERLSRLESLAIIYSRIDDRGLRYLQGLPLLRELHLSDAPITDAGVESLSRLKSLKHLGLINTKVSDAGAARLRLLLPQCDVQVGKWP
jgi:hypothetical protein